MKPAHRDETSISKPVDTLLTTKQAATACGLSQSTLRKWRCIGVGPRFARIGRSVRYRMSELDAFIDVHTFASTAQADAD